MKTNGQFILFAVQQAREAEAFGFTRNECCRNLKTALHQYWQNKTLKMHGQARKAHIPRSRAARDLPLNECDVEHVVPQMVIVNWLMDLEPLSEAAVVALLHRYFKVLLVTRAEHAALNAGGVRSTMPADWDREDLYARYRLFGIEPPEPGEGRTISHRP